MRTAGILCGAALAMALLIAVLGVPRLTTEALQQPAPQAAAAELPQATANEAPQDVATLMVPPEPAPQPEPMPEPMPEPQPEPREPLPQPRLAAPQPAELRPADNGVDAASAEHWFAFWSPFRSELAANGFVVQLQKTTGLNYRVVRLEPGVYEVAFAYESDADIATQLAAIATATGLEMPDG